MANKAIKYRLYPTTEQSIMFKAKKMANKAIKYRLYPTAEQSIMFAKTFGCCRKVYNLMLSDKLEAYKSTGKFPMVTPAKYKTEPAGCVQELFQQRP